MLQLTVKFNKSITPFGQDTVGKVVNALQKKLNLGEDISIGVMVTDKEKVRELNRKYGGKDESTDVLSFNYAEGPESPKAKKAGDVVISYQHVQKQSRAAKTTAENELALLVTHGVLHILGHDHTNERSRQLFDKLQKEVVEAAGLAYRDFGWKS